MLNNKSENSLAEKAGNKTGYVFSYLLFTSVLYFILYFSDKLPESWTFFHVMLITISISLLGFLINLTLK